MIMSLTTCSPGRLRDVARRVSGRWRGWRTPASTPQESSMRAIRPALAIAAGALTLAAAPMLASPASALAAPNVVGAIANIQGNEPLNQTVLMPRSTSFNSTQTDERGTIHHQAVGIYGITFEGLVPKDPNGGFLDPGGVVHVRAKGAGGVCHAPSGESGMIGTKSDGKLSLLVECWDGAGRAADRPFTLSYTRGGTQKGSLITARMPNGAGLPLNQRVVLKVGETSINASTPSTTNSGVSVTRTAVGEYTFLMFAGTGPSTIQLTPTLAGFKPGAVCGITGTSVASALKSVKISCRGPLNAGPVDVGLHLSYAHGINLLGLTTLSSAYLSMPKTTAASTNIQPADMLNTINGLNGGGGVLRNAPGRYEVGLPNQQKHFGAETFTVTAEDSTADCQITSSLPQFGFQQLRVACSNSSLNATDTAFQLHYAGKQ